MESDPKAIYIYYISGTGNARASSYWIADEAGKRGIKTVVQQIDRLENIEMPAPEEASLIGFAFPTHGFNAAPLMLRFIAGFPTGLCHKVFLLNTRAGMKLSKLYMPGLSGIALLLPAFILLLKGYRCTGFRPVDLPSNWIPLHPGLKQKVIDSIFIRCERIVRDFANKMIDGKKVYRGLLSLPVDIIISPVGFAYYLGGRFFLSKTFIANQNCNNCGICIKECPTSSIKFVQNRPYWKLTCESCMRCLNHCPHKAIEAAHGMAFFFWFIYTVVNAQFILLLIRVFDIQTDLWWMKVITFFTGLAIMVITATLLYKIFHYLMGIKPVRFLIRYTSLTSLPFWRRYDREKNKNHEKQF